MQRQVKMTKQEYKELGANYGDWIAQNHIEATWQLQGNTATTPIYIAFTNRFDCNKFLAAFNASEKSGK